MSLTQTPFGVTRDGTPVTLFRLENSSGAYAEMLDYGATIRSVTIPDKCHRLTDVCLGYDDLVQYEESDGCLGATVGRFANRVKGASFTLNGRTYLLTANKGANHQHGGKRGFQRRVWAHRIEGETLVLTLFSPDGEEGYPGGLTAEARFTFTEDNALMLDLSARCDADTVVNLTNHAYWNLEGHGAGNVGRHILRVRAGAYTEMDRESCTTGALAPVEGAPMDLRAGAPLDRGWDADHPQIKIGRGYDLNWALDGDGLREAAALYCEESGIALTLSTTQPGLQVYTANGLSPRKGKGGADYGPRCAVALETQNYPDAPRHPGFPSAVLRAGEEYRHRTVFAFGVR